MSNSNRCRQVGSVSCAHIPTILINASNLRVGGGVQVAVSFIVELSKLTERAACFDVVVSNYVHKNLQKLNFESSVFSSYTVLDSYGVFSLFTGFSRFLAQYDLVFTIFGPLYSLCKPRISLVGFAQAWIAYPDNEVYCLMPWRLRAKTKIKFFLQKLMFKRADHLVVELEHVREQLIKLNISNAENTSVVSNCVSDIYLHENEGESASKVKITKRSGTFAIGFVGRDYLHKNTRVLPEVKAILKERYSLDVDFFVTFTESEWLIKSSDFKAAIINVGELDVVQCLDFYRKIDAVIFPSLLECFSATPLEALAMRRPLFASARDFVSDVCGAHAHYFDPLDPSSIAESINEYFSSSFVFDADRLAIARSHAIEFSSAEVRAMQYVRLIDKLLAQPTVGV